MTTILLYTTDACTLCDNALSMIKVCINKQTQRLSVIDIVEHDDLIERYGDKIPVLYRADKHSQLNWPFSPADVHNFLL